MPQSTTNNGYQTHELWLQTQVPRTHSTLLKNTYILHMQVLFKHLSISKNFIEQCIQDPRQFKKMQKRYIIGFVLQIPLIQYFLKWWQ